MEVFEDQNNVMKRYCLPPFIQFLYQYPPVNNGHMCSNLRHPKDTAVKDLYDWLSLCVDPGPIIFKIPSMNSEPIKLKIGVKTNISYNRIGKNKRVPDYINLLLCKL